MQALGQPEMKSTRLYCSGYWLVDGNKKRSREHYAALLRASLDMIQGEELVFYSSDDAQIELVQRLAENRLIAFTGVLLAVECLPARILAESLVAACQRMELDKVAMPPNFLEGRFGREKGVAHYWRDLKGSGHLAYLDILTIWLSKISLASKLAHSGPADRPVAWMDVSVSRFSEIRENPNFHALNLPADKLSHYQDSGMRYCGEELPLNASFMSATAPVWARVEAEFRDAASRAATMAYGHDEETVLADCVWLKPDMFHCIGKKKAYDLRPPPQTGQ